MESLTNYFEGVQEMTNMSTFEQFFYYFEQNGSYVWDQFTRHFLITLYGVVFAAIVAIPLGFIIARRLKLANWVIGVANVIQTVPSLAILSLLMLVMGFCPITVVFYFLFYFFYFILYNNDFVF